MGVVVLCACLGFLSATRHCAMHAGSLGCGMTTIKLVPRNVSYMTLPKKPWRNDVCGGHCMCVNSSAYVAEMLLVLSGAAQLHN